MVERTTDGGDPQPGRVREELEDHFAEQAVGGELDVYTATKLRDTITELLAAGVHDVIIDMLDVEFLDSSGLGVLVGALKKVRAHDGSLQLICNQDRLLKIFRITGLAKVFVIHESADAALAGN